jgi:hypothetical protein
MPAGAGMTGVSPTSRSFGRLVSDHQGANATLGVATAQDRSMRPASWFGSYSLVCDASLSSLSFNCGSFIAMRNTVSYCCTVRP